jgi:hypothetical protein
LERECERELIAEIEGENLGNFIGGKPKKENTGTAKEERGNYSKLTLTLQFWGF